MKQRNALPSRGDAAGWRGHRTGAAVSMTVLSFATLIAGCAGEAAPASTVTVRDSAGISIVEARVVTDELPVWRLSDVPVLDIGGDESDPAQQLFSVAGTARLSDGRIVIAEDGNLRLRFYDGSGAWLRDVGRSGEGPGEYRDLGRPYVVAGDSIVVFDVRLRRFTLLRPDGEYVRDWQLEQPLSDAAVTPVLLLATGEWLARPGFSFSASTPTGLHRPVIPYLRFESGGAYIDSVGGYPGPETFVYSDDGQSLAMVFPFLGSSRLTAGPDGGFWFGSADRYEIERRAADGRLLSLTRAVDVDVAMPAGRLDAWKQEVADEVGDDQRQFFERVLAALPPVERVPAYSALRTDRDGHLWVRDFAWPGEATAFWRVFDASGAPIARVEAPGGLTVGEIGADWLLGTWTDELGVEHVQLFGLNRGR